MTRKIRKATSLAFSERQNVLSRNAAKKNSDLKIVASPDDDESVGAHAKAALIAAGGDVTSAAAILEEEVRGDGKLYRALLDPLLRQACVDAISKVIRTRRSVSWSGRAPDPSSEADERRIEALAASNLMMFPLIGGKPICDGKRDDVLASADHYEKLSADTGHKARWLRAVAKLLKPTQVVKHVLSERRLRELQEETKNA